jgi:hypothetical protein
MDPMGVALRVTEPEFVEEALTGPMGFHPFDENPIPVIRVDEVGPEVAQELVAVGAEKLEKIWADVSPAPLGIGFEHAKSEEFTHEAIAFRASFGMR